MPIYSIYTILPLLKAAAFSFFRSSSERVQLMGDVCIGSDGSGSRLVSIADVILRGATLALRISRILIKVSRLMLQVAELAEEVKRLYQSRWTHQQWQRDRVHCVISGSGSGEGCLGIWLRENPFECALHVPLTLYKCMFSQLWIYSYAAYRLKGCHRSGSNA